MCSTKSRSSLIDSSPVPTLANLYYQRYNDSQLSCICESEEIVPGSATTGRKKADFHVHGRHKHELSKPCCCQAFIVQGQKRCIAGPQDMVLGNLHPSNLLLENMQGELVLGEVCHTFSSIKCIYFIFFFFCCLIPLHFLFPLLLLLCHLQI